MGVLVGDFYLMLGQARRSRPLPKDVRAGQMKQCYMNAGRLATERPQFIYCEGYARRKGVPLAVHHAWCLDEEGYVLDLTWPYDEENEYLGVALHDRFLLESLSANGYWGILSEHLPDSVVKHHPRTYLHETCQPAADRVEAFWNKLEAHVQNVRGS
jgi:hypothetical protein